MAAIGSLGLSATADKTSNAKNYQNQLTKSKKRNKINK
jgi:hypothetical protein